MQYRKIEIFYFRVSCNILYCLNIYQFHHNVCVLTDFLGRTEIRIQDILKETRETKGPILKQLELHEVDSGKVELKLDLQLFDS